MVDTKSSVSSMNSLLAIPFLRVFFFFFFFLLVFFLVFRFLFFKFSLTPNFLTELSTFIFKYITLRSSKSHSALFPVLLPVLLLTFLSPLLQIVNIPSS